MTIRIDEASLIRAGLPRDFVAAMRELVAAASSTVTDADLAAIQAEVDAAVADIAAIGATQTQQALELATLPIPSDRHRNAVADLNFMTWCVR